MKLTVKTLKGELIQLDVASNETILDLKNKIKDQKGYDVDCQKIVFKGKSTSNTDDLDKLGVKQGDFLVVMYVVKKNENPKKVEEKASEVNPVKQQKPKQSIKQQKQQVKPQKKSESKSEQPQDQSQINELMSMGFPRDQCAKALKAAWGNADRAVQYLLSGHIPENGPQPSNQGQQLNGEMGTALLAQLVNSPQFAQIKSIIRSNPAALEPLMGQLQQSSPQLYTLIASNPEAFQQLILNDGPTSQVSQMPMQPPPGTIMVTAEEQQAIQRLMALGFSKLEAAQAYMACDKNEEMAANLLFDRLANGDIDMDQGLNQGGNGGNQGGQGGQGGQGDDDEDNLFN